MRKIIQAIFALSAGAIAAAPGGASAQALGASVGTDGIGADAFFKLAPLVTARGGFRYADFDPNRDIDGIDYNLDFGFTSGVAAVDLHPFANGFRLSGGAYIGDRDIDLRATPNAPVEIGGQIFTPQEAGVIDGASGWNSFAPFVGFGFNNAGAIKRVGFQAMLGAMYIGEPGVELTSSDGLLSNDPAFLVELDAEEDRLREDLDDIRFYPVLNLGLVVRF